MKETTMRGIQWCFRAFLFISIIYMSISLIAISLSIFAIFEKKDDFFVESQKIAEGKIILAPADAIPFKFRDFCQFLEDPIYGSEGILKIADEPRKTPKSYQGKYQLRGLMVLTRHGERSPLTKDQRLLEMISCAPFHETDRKAFDHYAKMIESKDFRNFFKEDPALSDGFSNRPHCSKCVGGQMTAEGALQHHRLGNFFYEKYWNSTLFLNDQLEIFTMTTPYNRTWQSLTAFVSGFLYPLKKITGNLYANFSTTTYLCSEHEKWCECKRALEWRRQYEREHIKYFQMESASQIRDQCQIFQQLVTTKGFVDPFDFQDKMFGFYSCRRFNLPCTEKGQCVTYELLEQLMAETSLRGETMFNRETDFIAKRLQLAEAYSIIGKIVKIIAVLRENRTKNKITLLSGHDSTIGPLLRVFRVLPEDPPRYASRVVFEFFTNEDHGIFLRLLFNGKDLTAKLPFCGVLVDGLCEGKYFEEFFSKGFWEMSTKYKTPQQLCEQKI